MALIQGRLAAVALIVLLLQACGGGGSDSNPPPPPPPPSASLAINPETVAVTATPGDVSSTRSVTMTIANAPSELLFVQVSHTNAGIESVTAPTNISASDTLDILFRSASSMPNGSYDDTVTVHVCTDSQCVSDIDGSPATIETTYTVTGDGPSTVSVDRTSIDLFAGDVESVSRTETLWITTTNPPDVALSLRVLGAAPPIQSTYLDATMSNTLARLELRFLPAAQLGAGTHTNTLTVSGCYDETCVRQTPGSPFTVTYTMTVPALPDPDVNPLAADSRVTLPHGVVDAEFSKPLNQIIMISRTPANALHIYDVATGVERTQLLAAVPNCVSVSPDGLTAAVGHDHLVSIVDLTVAGLPGAPVPVTLNASENIFDIVLDGNGNVHALADGAQFGPILSINIATNVETPSAELVYTTTRGRLHPSGFLYTTDRGPSPNDIEKWDVTSGSAVRLYDSPYEGEHPMCGNLWFNEEGNTIHTRCGEAFSSSLDPFEDLTFKESLALSLPNASTRSIRSVSQVAAHHELALIEDECGFNPLNACNARLTLFESDGLDRLATYTIGPVDVGGTDVAERGLFVFHDAATDTKYLLTSLEGVPNVEFYLLTVR